MEASKNLEERNRLRNQSPGIVNLKLKSDELLLQYVNPGRPGQ